MWKKVALSALLLGAALSPVGRTRGESVAARVDKQKEEIILRTGGKSYVLSVARGIPRIQVDTVSYPLMFRCAEWGAAPDWFKVTRLSEASVTEDGADAKTARAVFDLAFVRRKPPLGSRRRWEPKVRISARLEMVLKVRSDAPCLFLTARVVNTGDPFECYMLLLLGGGNYFAVPGPAGIEKREFRHKYADVKEGTGWVYLARDTVGLGAALRNRLLLREAGSSISRHCRLFLNTAPKSVKLKKGEASEMKLALMPASSAEEVAAIYKKLQR